MSIYQRFLSLPRGRKGNTTVIIVEEAELERLIIDAQAAEYRMIFPERKAAAERAFTTIAGGATGGPPMQIHIDPGPPPAAAVIETLERIISEERRRPRGLR